MTNATRGADNLDAEITALITRYEAACASDASGVQGNSTAHRHRSVDLRSHLLEGFRATDTQAFTGIPLHRKSLVEFGCKMGEMTRRAAIAGAEFAEGIEDEDLLVRIGNLASAYHRLGNVVIRQGDLTGPGLLRQHYDIGASFSGFERLRNTLPEILSQIDGMFILETPALTGGWFNRYVTPFLEHMPYWCVCGITDQGTAHAEGRRGQLLFARTPDALNDVLLARARQLPGGSSIVATLDVEQSVMPKSLLGRSSESCAIFQKARETIAAIPVGDQDAAAEVLGAVGDALAAVAPADEPARFSSDSYWAALFQGARRYRARGQVDRDNPLVGYLRRMASTSEPGMREILSDEHTVAPRAAERLDGFLQAIADRKPRDHFVAHNPVRADLASVSMFLDRYQNFALDDGSVWYVHSFDGYHRLAACWLAKVARCTVMFCWTNMNGLTTFNFAPASDGASHAAIERILDTAVLRFAYREQAA
jgi:hypothetical protein